MFKSILKISSIILLLFSALTFFLYWQTNVISNLIKDTLNSNLEGVAEIHYKQLSGNLFETIEIDDLTIILEDSSTIYTNKINIEYNLSSIIFKPYLIRSINFDSLYLTFNIKQSIKEETEKKPFTIEDIPTLLDSLLDVQSIMNLLPELLVDQLEIKSGSLNIPEYNLHVENINLNTKYSFVSDKLNFEIDKLSGKWIEKDLRLKHFQVSLNATKSRITLNKLQIETDKSHIYVKSEINYEDKTWIIFDLEEIYLDYSDISRFAKIEQIDTGWVHGSVNIVGSPQKFSGQLFVKGETNNYKIDSLVVDTDYRANTLFVRKGKILINNSLLTFEGSGSRQFSRGKIVYNKFNVTNLIPESITTNLTGNVSFNVKELDLKHLSGKVDLNVHESMIDSIKIDTLKFALLATNNNFDIIEPSFLRFGDSSLFSVRGNLDRNMILNAELFTENNHLPQLFSALNFDTLNGKFDANLTMIGEVENPDLKGYLFLPNISKNEIMLDTIILDLELEKIFTSRKGSAHFSIKKGDIDGFKLTEALVNSSFDSNRITFDTLRFANNLNYISLAGFVEQNIDTFNLGLDLVKIFYQNYWIENSDSVLIDFFPHEYVIDQAQFKAPGAGVIECRGFWDNDIKDLQLGVYVENIHVDPFTQFIDTEKEIGGVINGEFHIIDPLSEMDIESEVTGDLITFDKSVMGNVSMDVEYDNGSIYFREFNLKKGNTILSASGDIALKFVEENGEQKIDFIEGTEADLSMVWDNFNLSQYQSLLNLKQSIKGSSSGELLLTGTLKNPELKLNILADSLEFEKYKIKNLNLFTHYTNDTLRIDSLVSEINNTNLMVEGWQEIPFDFTDLNFDFANNPFEISIYSDDDCIDFLGNFLDQIEKISGDYETQIVIAGTPSKPVIKDGYFKIDDGELTLSRVKDPVTNLNLEANIKDSILTIENFNGYSIKDKDILEETWSYFAGLFRFLQGDIQSEGELSGNGTIDLTDIYHPQIDLDLNLYEFYVDYFVENTQLLVSSENLSITGRDTLNLNGDIIIGEGKYTVDLDKMRKKVYLSSTEINKGRAVSWNLNINIPENFIIASSTLDLVNNFELEISGELRAIQEPYSPEMGLTGNVEILSGTYVAFGQKFEIRQGSIDFTNPQKINPEIELFAEKETNEYTVELAVNGNLERLERDLQIRDANGVYLTNISMREKLKYLSGTASSEGGSELVSTGQDVINTSVETALERGAQSVTGLDKVEIHDSQGMVDLQSMKLNNGLQDASISIGKYLTSNLYLEYRSRFGAGTIPAPKLSWEAGNQLSLAYKINRNWSVESAYAQTLRGNTLINISLGWKTSF